jgi:hypothetical protein
MPLPLPLRTIFLRRQGDGALGPGMLPPMIVRIFADLRVPKQPKLCPTITDFGT